MVRLWFDYWQVMGSWGLWLIYLLIHCGLLWHLRQWKLSKVVGGSRSLGVGICRHSSPFSSSCGYWTLWGWPHHVPFSHHGAILLHVRPKAIDTSQSGIETSRDELDSLSFKVISFRYLSQESSSIAETHSKLLGWKFKRLRKLFQLVHHWTNVEKWSEIFITIISP